MSFFVIVHSIMVVCYAGMTYHIWRGWKDNQLEKKFNVALRNSAIALVEDMQLEIDKNEKLVAEAKSQVAAAMAAVRADMSPLDSELRDPNDMMADPAMLSTILTAIVIKYGEMRLGMKDVMVSDENEYVSVYVDTRTKEMVLSTKHDLEGTVSYFTQTGPDDDETYH
jgi:multisubunit Na+/H+ antiporter MnhC subunit